MGRLTFNTDEVSEWTLAPLPDGWSQGFLSVGIVGACSFASSSLLFLFTSYALIGWHHNPRKKATPRLRRHPGNHISNPDLSLGLDVKYLAKPPRSRADSDANVNSLFSDDHSKSVPVTPQGHTDSQVHPDPEVASLEPTNPLLVLIYNLLVADAISALEFTLNLVWVSANGVFVPSATCTFQAFVASVGAIAPSTFLATIALHNHLVIVWGYKIQPRGLRWWLCAVWGLIGLFPLLGIVISRNGADHGGWYVRGDTWCSSNDQYETLRFLVEFLPVMISLACTVILYLLIGVTLIWNRRSDRHLPTSSVASESRRQLTGHHPAFFVYPVIYLCTMGPLGICRLMMMSGRQLQPRYYFGSAATIASQGLLNCILWTTTIHFLSREVIAEIGLDHFMRTPDDRIFGNIVYIQGGQGESESDANRSHRGFVRVGSALGHHGDDGKRESRRGRPEQSNSSQLSLQQPSGEAQGGIQLQTITAVVYEKNDRGGEL